MKCKNRVLNDNGKGCIHFLDGGFCKQRTEFRCKDWMRMYELPIDHSSLMMFMQCRRKYWLSNIEGWQCRDEELPIRMKMGILFDRICNFLHNGQGNKKHPDDWEGLLLWESQKYFPEIVKDLSESNDNDGVREVVKLRALLSAYTELGLNKVKGGVQYKWSLDIGESKKLKVYGTCDQVLEGPVGNKGICVRFYERKYTGSPDFYGKFFIEDQLSTYFMGIPEAKCAVLQLTRVPALKSTFSYRDETLEQYEVRVYRDIMSRPKYYFKGYTKNNPHGFGIVYWKSEFKEAIEEKKKQYEIVSKEIHSALRENNRDWFYKNKAECFRFTDNPCMFLPICENGNVSESIYVQRDKTNWRGKEN
jgi:hypothetical protein